MGRLAVAIGWLLISAVSWADSAWKEVWNSESAARRTAFEGQATTRTLVDEREEKAIAQVRAAGGKIRLDYQAGVRRWSLIDDGRRLIRLQPQKRSAIALPRPQFAIDPALAERNYAAQVVGHAEIAGRTARVVEIRLRSRGKLAGRLWLDRETGFALKRERYNIEGKLVSGTEYTSLRFGASVEEHVFSIPPDWRVIERDRSVGYLNLSELSREVGFDVAAPSYLPSGYVLQGGYAEQRGRRGLLAAELRYTDGLRVLSIRERPRGRERDSLRGGRGGGRGGFRGGHGWGRGRGRGFGPPRQEITLVDRGGERALRYFGRRLAIVIVGDLTSDEIVRMAKSID